MAIKHKGHDECGSYGYVSAKKLYAEFKCDKCKKLTKARLHVEGVAFGCETFATCQSCGYVNQVNVHTI